MGLYPAWQSSRADLVDGLKDGGRAYDRQRGQQRFRRGLVATQVGFSVLARGGGDSHRQFRSAEQSGGWFRTKNLWTGGIGMPPAGYPDPEACARFADRLLAVN